MPRRGPWRAGKQSLFLAGYWRDLSCSSRGLWMALGLEGLWQPHRSWHEPGSWDSLSSQCGCVTSASAGYWACCSFFQQVSHMPICARPCPRAPGMSQMVALSQAWAPCPSPGELELTGRHAATTLHSPQDLSFSWTFISDPRSSEASLASCHYQTDCFRAKRLPLLLWPAVSSPGPRAAAPLASGPCRPFPCWRQVVTELRGSKA